MLLSLGSSINQFLSAYRELSCFTAKDDQEIVQYEAWLNGQKVHWQEAGGEVPLDLQIEEGHNNLNIYLTDNQGIEHVERITILGKRVETTNDESKEPDSDIAP